MKLMLWLLCSVCIVGLVTMRVMRVRDMFTPGDQFAYLPVTLLIVVGVFVLCPVAFLARTALFFQSKTAAREYLWCDLAPSALLAATVILLILTKT